MGGETKGRRQVSTHSARLMTQAGRGDRTWRLLRRRLRHPAKIEAKARRDQINARRHRRESTV